MTSIIANLEALLAESPSSSIKVSITSEMKALLARALRQKLYLAQKTESGLTQVQSCVAHYIPSKTEGKLGKSIRPCHSKHACLLCTPQEFGKEEAKISSLLNLWSQEGLVIFLTFNLPFTPEMDLGSRYSLLRQCWESLMGDSRMHNLRVRRGIKYVRVLEERLIEGHWFPHFHVALLIEGLQDSEQEFLDYSAPIRSLWADKARKHGLPTTLSSVQDARRFIKGTHYELANYLTTNGRVGLHLDAATYDLSRGSFTPIELFQLFVGNGDADAKSHWEEFEFFSSGKQRFTYSVKARRDLQSLKSRKSLVRQNNASERPLKSN
jgi:hypothetical protein